MDQSTLDKLDAAWERGHGFLGLLWEGTYEEALYVDFLHTLKNIAFEPDELIPRSVVSLLWYIPLYMEWQVERVAHVIPPKEYALKKTRIENELERILGIP